VDGENRQPAEFVVPLMQPLSGLLVLDFSTLLPGPLASLMLAEAGAEVIKIERPGGEEMRTFAPEWEGESAAFGLLNRGKQVVTLDLKNAKDRETLKPLLARADILLEQFRPGVMDRLGLGFETLHRDYPKLIYCSITGYGATGSRARSPALWCRRCWSLISPEALCLR
jgi:crotonobetainyl-CoA:carnitine CoA-transferase CaiB-like acyl-CoA transferase